MLVLMVTGGTASDGGAADGKDEGGDDETRMMTRLIGTHVNTACVLTLLRLSATI